MKKKISYILFFFMMLLVGFAAAQTSIPKPLSKNLISLRSLAEKEFRASQYETAIALYQSYFKKISFVDTTAIFNVAESYRLSRQYDSAIAAFHNLVLIQPAYLPNLAELYATKGNYSKAVEIYKSIQTTDTVLIQKIESRLIGFKGREDFQLDSLDWKVTRSAVNTEGNESNAMRYKDGILYISSAIGKSGAASNIGTAQLLFAPDTVVSKEISNKVDTVSKKKTARKKTVRIPIDITARNSIDNNTLRRPLQLQKPSSTKEADLIDPFLAALVKTGPLHFSSNADTVYYSSPVKLKNKSTKLGIFFAVKQNDAWKESAEITSGFNFNAFHPTATANGRKIFFVSDARGGFGGPDIYFVERMGDTAWSSPANAGNLINTPGNELYPSIMGDSLYFSSNGRGGLGGQDVFAVKLGADEFPVNLGYPINSSYDDYGFVFNKDRTGGYVTTNRNGSNDIFAFNFKKVYYRVGGSINYASDNTLASREQVFLVDAKTDKQVDSTITDALGNYYFDLRPNRLYRIEQRENGLSKGSYVVNTKEPVYLDSSLLAKKVLKDSTAIAANPLVDTAAVAILQRIADIDSLVALEKTLNATKLAIQQLQKEAVVLEESPAAVDSSLVEATANVAKKKLIQSQLRELTADLTRLEYKKLELSFALQPPKDVVAINSTKPVEKIKIDIKLPGVSPKQKADSIAYVRQQQIIQLKMEEEELLRGDQLTRFNVYFGFSKSSLNLIEQKILDSTIKVLKANPKLYAVMGSFTDCSGPIDFNMQLSARRSAAVIKYLLKNGIDKNRIRENHYGKNYLVQNCSPKRYSSRQQLLNRRTEIYLTDDRSLAWTDLAADTTKKYTVYTALGKKLSDFVSLKGVLVVAPKKRQLAVDSSKLLTVNRQLKSVDSSQLTVNRKPTTVNRQPKTVDSSKLLTVNRQLKSVDSSQLTVNRKPVTVKVQQPIVKKDTIAVVAKKVAEVKEDTTAVVAKKVAEVKKDTIAVVAKKVTEVKKDTIAVVATKVAEVKKDTVPVVAKKVAEVKKDTIAVVAKKVVEVRKDTVAVAKVEVKRQEQETKPTTYNLQPKTIQTDSFVVVKPQPKQPVVQPTTYNLQPTNPKIDSFVVVKPQPKQPAVQPTTYNLQPTTPKIDSFVVVKPQPTQPVVQPTTPKIDSFVVAKPQPKPAAVQPTTYNLKPTTVQSDTIAIAKAQLTTDEEDRITREELLAALDSLAKLRREQERIVEYLTKRINKKPIEVFTYADSVTVEIFDSGIHDKDSVSVIYNRTLVVDKHELKVDKPIKFKVRVDKERRNNEMVIVAENLGTYPPNTAVMIITDKFGKHEEIMLSTDLTTNEVVIFIRIDKQANSNPTKNQP
jgi:outer membrane protein OmpA-like peptidoglycan-associated protein